MADNRTKKVLLGMTRQKLEEMLVSSFEHHRGRGYFHMDYDYGEFSWVNAYDRLLSSFDQNQREVLENQVKAVMAQPGIHRIMDQGCAHANTLREVTRRFSKEYYHGKFEG